MTARKTTMIQPMTRWPCFAKFGSVDRDSTILTAHLSMSSTVPGHLVTCQQVC